MQLPEFVGIGEMVDMLGLSKTRVQQLIVRDDFPRHYLWLQMGRFWQVNDVIEWANSTGRTVHRNIPDRTARPRKTYKRPPRPRVVVDRIIPVDNGTVSTNTVAENGMNDRAVNGNAVDETDEVGLYDRTGPPYKMPVDSPSTISSYREEQEETPASSRHETLNTHTGDGGVGEGPDRSQAASTPDRNSDPIAKRRASMELDKQALADEWDMLEDLYLRGPKEALTPGELKIYPFAIMVIRAEGTVPTYRRTKASLVKAWDVVRVTFDATQADLADAARYLMDEAMKPWSAGAVKKFSERRIPQARLASLRSQKASGPNRWQGAHGAHDAAIASWSDEEKRRWGVIPRD